MFCIYTGFIGTQVATLIISTAVRVKLDEKHQVCEKEVLECFHNHYGTCLEDDREEHKTAPATNWFISETNHNRVLKVVFMLKDGNIHIKSAYEPGMKDIEVYRAMNP